MRLQPRARSPAPGRSPRRAGSAHTARPPARSPPAPPGPARGGRGLTSARALAPGLARSRPPPRRMAAASGQRRFLAPAATVRWAFESGPGLTFQDARLKASVFPQPPPSRSRLPLGAGLPPAPAPSSSRPAPEEFRGPGGSRPGPQHTRGHLPEENGGGVAPATQLPPAPPASSAPSPWRRPSLESVRKRVPLLSSIRFGLFPHRSSAGRLATHSPCCKRYRSPGRDHTTTQLARSTRTNSPPPPPAPHKHLPPPNPSAAHQITEHHKRVPANPLPSNFSRDHFIHSYVVEDSGDKGKGRTDDVNGFHSLASR